jgi:ubiquinol-cytochrome c reductase cytochrome b subunit
MLSIPLVGTYLTLFAFEGQYPGTAIIPRLFTLHILLVPGLLLALVGAHLTLVFYLKHTQWSGPGRTNRNVVGLPFFPQFLTRTLGLMFSVFGVAALMAGLLQINPIWRYGPYTPVNATAGSQPDWYIGFLEGALRLMPAVETRVFGHTVSWNVLLPAVVLPGVMFGLLYAYPFLERWITPTIGEHNLCDRPRNVPARTGLGVAGIVFYTVLLLAGANDVIANTLRIDLNALTWVLRVALIVLPPVGFLVAKRACLGLQARDRDRLIEGEETGDVEQSLEGGFHTDRRPLPVSARYVLLAQDRAVPLPEGPAEAGRVRAGLARLRRGLSGWFHRDRVELPLTEIQRRELAAITESPRAPEKSR